MRNNINIRLLPIWLIFWDEENIRRCLNFLGDERCFLTKETSLMMDEIFPCFSITVSEHDNSFCSEVSGKYVDYGQKHYIDISSPKQKKL